MCDLAVSFRCVDMWFIIINPVKDFFWTNNAANLCVTTM